MARKLRVHSAGALYHAMCPDSQGQSIFKELAKELQQKSAVLSRGLGKLAEELASKSELRSVVETL
jgi:hypothetical protein